MWRTSFGAAVCIHFNCASQRTVCRKVESAYNDIFTSAPLRFSSCLSDWIPSNHRTVETSVASNIAGGDNAPERSVAADFVDFFFAIANAILPLTTSTYNATDM